MAGESLDELWGNIPAKDGVMLAKGTAKLHERERSYQGHVPPRGPGRVVGFLLSFRCKLPAG